MPKKLNYAAMTPEQQASARRWAEKWGMRPEACPMLPSGRIVTNRAQIVPVIGEEDYDIISKHYAPGVSFITEEIRQLYRAEMAQLKADNLPKVRLK